MPSPLADPRAALARFGPDRCERTEEREARAWCRSLAQGRYENFSVVTRLVPGPLRDDFAAVYGFCRWADDLGDEFGDRARSLELLGWWRRELEACFAGEPRHPIFVALRPTIVRHELPREPFERLIRAFELDQTKTRYATWDETLAYCRDSADPVGQLVLMLLGEPRDPERFRRSDCICTALQLTNHWQDIRRDLAERDRIYVPSEVHSVERFEERLRATIAQGYACDATFLEESRGVVRSLVERTWPLYEDGETLLPMLSPVARPVVWLFLAGGTRVLRQIELWNCETVLHRPYLTRPTKALLVARAWWLARRGNRVAEHSTNGVAPSPTTNGTPVPATVPASGASAGGRS